MGDSIVSFGLNPENRISFWTYYALILFYFIIVTLICVNMTMAIIIDTFSELTDSDAEMRELIENYCFICSIEREIFALKYYF